MLEHAQDLLDWIGRYPRGSLVLLFLVAMLDSIFLIGAIVPAAIVLFAVGAVVALGVLDLGAAVLVGAAGALTGDALSFMLGRRYGSALFESRFLAKYPEAVGTGRKFFERHGLPSVFLARFLGPVRSITPAIAGASGIAISVFFLVDAVAALLWALVYLLPGVLFGASLKLASEVAARLAGLLVLSSALLFGGIYAARAGIGIFNRYAERWLQSLLDWSRRHRRLGRFGPVLADPAQPETPALLTVAALLITVGLLWLASFGGMGWRDYPGALDALIHQTVIDLSTPWGTAAAQVLYQIGAWPTYSATAMAVLAALVWRRKLRAAAHWIAALLFGVCVTFLLEWLPVIATPAEYFGRHHHEDASSLRDLILPTIIYGAAASIYATHRPRRIRSTAYGLAVSLVVLIALSRLVLLQDWISMIGFSLTLGLLWVAALTLGYRRHGPERLFAASFGVPIVSVFLLALGVSWGADRAAHLQARVSPAPAPVTLSQSDWIAGSWMALPAARIDMRGRNGRSFSLQWATSPAVAKSTLEGAGWTTVPPMGASDALRWLTQTTRIDELPVLPLVHAGEHPVLTMRRVLELDRQELVRFWDSRVRLDRSPDSESILLGQVVEQRVGGIFTLLRYPVTVSASQLRSFTQATLPVIAEKSSGLDGHSARLLLSDPLNSAPTDAVTGNPSNQETQRPHGRR